MKARLELGAIKLYGKLPSKYRSGTLNILGGFHKLETSVHEAEGFFDVVTPEGVDYEVQTLGAIYFDENNRVFTYPVLDLEIDLEAEKVQRKADLKRAIEDEIMLALGCAVLEKLALGEEIPQMTKDIVLGLRAQEQATLDEIDAFEDPKLLRKYKIKREDVEQSKELLKSVRKL